MSEIILLEGIEDFNEIKKFKEFNDKIKIITFDFISHKELQKKKIPHEMVEDFITKNDEKNIDEKSFEMTLKWHQVKEITNLIKFRGVNLGSLLNHEMTDYFCRHLKRIIGIIKILEKEKPSKIICYSLTNYVNTITNGKKIQIVSTEYKIKRSLHDDQIHIPITLKGKTYSIKISRKNFLKIKKYLNKILNFIFKLNPDFDDFNNWVLLLDFNTEAYQNLFETISKQNKNIILLNQRRPAIWNFKSLSIIRNTKLKILNLDDMITKKKRNEIELAKKDNIKKIEQIFTTESFIDFFKIEQYSFFNIINDEFFQIIKNRFEESIKKIIILEEMFEKCKISCILEWGHVSMEEKIVLHIAKQKQVPTIFLQHGVYILNKKFEKYINHLAILPSENSKEAVWGNIISKYLLEHDIGKEEFFVTGSPRHDIFFKNISKTVNNNTVLILANNFSYINYTGSDSRAYEYLEKSVKEIIRILKLHNKKIIIKTHPGHSDYDIRPLIKEIDDTIEIYQDQDVFTFLRSCDCVIALNYSTTLLESMILKKPTMLILPDDQKFEEELPVKRKATLYVDKISQIESVLNDFLTNKDIRQKLINEGNKFVDDYFSHKGSASLNILKIINKYND